MPDTAPKVPPRDAPDPWLTDTGRHRLNAFVTDEALSVIHARVPRWTVGTAVACIVGALAIVASVGSWGVAMERTSEIPGLLRAKADQHEQTAILNTKVDALTRGMERLERHFGTNPKEEGQ